MTRQTKYWKEYWSGRLATVDEGGVYRSLDYSNERLALQTYAHVLEGLGPIAGKPVWDCGCGWGRFSLMLAAAGAKVLGSDVVARTVQQLHTRYPLLARWELVDLLDPDSVSRLPNFDCVTAVEVLQYVETEQALRSLWSRVRSGGRVVGTVPNAECPIVKGVVLRYGGKWKPVGWGELLDICSGLPDADCVWLKGLYFREDQRLCPYRASEWAEKLDGGPNRIVFAVVRQGAEGEPEGAPSERR